MNEIQTVAYYIYLQQFFSARIQIKVINKFNKNIQKNHFSKKMSLQVLHGSIQSIKYYPGETNIIVTKNF